MNPKQTVKEFHRIALMINNSKNPSKQLVLAALDNLLNKISYKTDRGAIRADGYYPFNGGTQNVWKKVKDLTEEEVKRMLNLDPNDELLFENKAYVVISGEKPWSHSPVGGKAWPIGTKAIYFHDYDYYLIETCPENHNRQFFVFNIRST